jgi:arylformamidase
MCAEGNATMTHDDAWYENQYNLRISIKNVPEIFEGWRKRSTQLRSDLQPMSDFKYGAHPRENLDLFRVPHAKATLVFIHGGYWRAFSKLETSFIAEHFVARGISVALINYPLCPDVSLGEIRNSVLKAFSFLWRRVLTDDEQRHVVVSGHSAGGHLSALHATENWQALGLPADPIKGIVSLSGLFDVSPLIHTSMNAELQLTAETASGLNLLTTAPHSHCRMLLAVGADESEEFHRQSQDLAKSWKGMTSRYESIAATNHFTIVENFADPASHLHQAVLSLMVG